MAMTLKKLQSPLTEIIVPFGVDPETQEEMNLSVFVAASEFTLKLQREMTGEDEKEVDGVKVPPDIWLFLRLVKDWSLFEDEEGTKKLPITLATLDMIEMPKLAVINKTIMATMFPNATTSQPSTAK